eukprot:TRINITY_DN57644_c0_g2_i1.p2 TRINITY_DN57644_c0_g2~~TRINITY_DN57644_c0_g2_i1.p2  ORF type:complete len:190 (+),score=19.32 TRINITY_DN57644_c0_g2_i1:178-747(+)
MAQNNGQTQQEQPGPPSHPTVIFFHYFFKGAALFWFIFCGFLTIVKGLVLNFVVVIVLLACDFWVVKNVTGRLLVGLRWWNEPQVDGNTNWKFEALSEGDRAINKQDKYMFWLATFVTPLIWALFILVELFRLEFTYILLCVLGVIMSGVNLYGYFKCTRWAQTAKNNVAQAVTQQVVQGGVTKVMDMV